MPPERVPAPMPPDRPRRTHRLTTAAVAAVLVVATLFVVVAAVGWWRAAHSPDRAIATARDSALLGARVDIATVNSLDYHHVDEGLARWLAVTTGTLHDQIAQATNTEKQVIERAKTTTQATVVDAAVTQVDPDAGTATVIASVDVQKTPATGQSVTARNRFSAAMRRVDGRWRLAGLTPVQVQLQ